MTSVWTRGSAVGAVVFVLGASAIPAHPAGAQEGRREIDAGNRLYEEGRYQEAHARYLEALAKVPGLPLARYNEGNALYRSGEFQRAMEAFREAAEAADPEWRSQAWYNLGNAFMRQQQLDAAAQAYKEGLRLDPGDLDAKHNLELALRRMEQPQEPQGGGGEGDNDQDQEQNQDQSQSQDQEQNQDQDQSQDQGENQDQNGQDGERQDSPDEGGGEDQQPPPDGRGGEGGQEEEDDSGENPRGSGAPAPGSMTEEQAERLLQGVTEDPRELDRKEAQPWERRPRKDW